jgi:hypothetical protein
MGPSETAGRTTCRCGGRGAKRLVRWLRFGGCFFGGLRCRRSGGGVGGSAGVRLFLDADQILIRDFPAEMLVLAALLEILFEEDGAPGIGYERAGSRQQDVPGAILHLHPAPEIRRVASHPVPSVVMRE